MIAHVLLFRPSPLLTSGDRDALIDAFERALTNIPLIGRAQIGRRHLTGRPYEHAIREDYPFMATLEFENEHDLLAYLEHPAHAELAERFFRSMESALVYDFEMTEGGRVREALADGRSTQSF